MPEENNSQPQTNSAPPNSTGSIDGIRPSYMQNASGPISPLIENRPVSENETSQNTQPVAEESNQNPKKKKNVFVIVIAVIVFLALSSVAAAMYLKKNDSSNKEPARNVNSLTEAAGSTSVDQTINEIDSLSNDEDTSGDGLSDSNLGL